MEAYFDRPVCGVVRKNYRIMGGKEWKEEWLYSVFGDCMHLRQFAINSE